LRATPCFIEFFGVLAWAETLQGEWVAGSVTTSAAQFGRVVPASPALADIRQHLQAFRGWQGGNATPKPRHPLLLLVIYRNQTENWLHAFQ
jgi:hypothetical protein